MTPATLRDSGAIDGVHLIPVGRFRQVAERLGPRTGTVRSGRSVRSVRSGFPMLPTRDTEGARGAIEWTLISGIRQ